MIMQQVVSGDGTRISYMSSGQGTSLIILGGSLADHTMYQALAQSLADHFHVTIYDRRNRGQSGRTPAHTLASELEDLAALVDLSQEPPVLLGHSAGAALAIHGASQGLALSKLILVDLPFTSRKLADSNIEQAAADFQNEKKTLESLLSRGDREGAVRFFLKDFGMSPEELDDFLASDSGIKAMDISPTLLVDYALLGDGMTPVSLLEKIQLPSLIIASPYGKDSADDSAQHLRFVRMAMIDAPLHSAPPSAVCKPILEFLGQEDFP